MIIRFSNFWQNSELQQKLFFIPLLERVFDTKITVTKNPEEKVDLELFSVFKPHLSFANRVLRKISRLKISPHLVLSKTSGNSWPQPEWGWKQGQEFGEVRKNAKRRIWFTGENKRPPLNEPFNSFLSFEIEGLAPGVHYLPIWVLLFDNFNLGPAIGFTSKLPSQENLLMPRVIDKTLFDSRKFCCSFIGNPFGFRIGILNELGKIDSIDTFGSAYGRTVKDKFTVASRYNFSFAFENALYPGYVTEKLLESYICENVPIYWGDDVACYFNPSSFINFYNYPNVESFVDQVIAVSSNFDSYEEIYTQPLLQRRYSIDSLVEELKSDLM